MEKYIKFIYYIFSLLLLGMVVGCAMPDIQQAGNLTIITPDYAPLEDTITRSIAGSTSTAISKWVSANQSLVRYEIRVESANKVVSSLRLTNTEKASLSVPSGVPLTIGIGVYLVENSKSTAELVNAYLVSDVQSGIILRPNETRYLKFTLDYRVPTRVAIYTPEFGSANAPGVADITGGVINGTNIPIFSIINLKDSVSNLVYYNSSTFNPINTTIFGSTPQGYAKLFKVSDLTLNYWYINYRSGQPYEVYRSGTFLNSIDFTTPITFSNTEDKPLLKSVYAIHNIYFSSSLTYYYFLNYGDGILGIKNDGSMGKISNIDFTNLTSVYPDQPFILDLEKDVSDNFTFFVSKIGTFYIDEPTLGSFAIGDRKTGTNGLRKLIRIPTPDDPRQSELITSVKQIGTNYIYLGTRNALYRIDKTDSAWSKFKASLYYVTFPSDAIKKIVEFDNEPIISLYTGGPSNNILIVTTPNRIWFYDGNKSSSLTIWDGLPFVPTNPYQLITRISLTDYQVHNLSAVRFVLWDSNNSCFWIGTKHGLSSINLNQLF